MRISIAKLTSSAVIPENKGNILTFFSALPIIVQPSEIKKVKTGLSVEVEEGYIIQILTCPELYEKGVSVFPGPLVTNQEKELFIPLQNSGRNPLNLLPGDIIARAIVTKLEETEITEVAPEVEPKRSNKGSRPQKKNTDFKFEIR
jgi:dUTPase